MGSIWTLGEWFGASVAMSSWDYEMSFYVVVAETLMHASMGYGPFPWRSKYI